VLKADAVSLAPAPIHDRGGKTVCVLSFSPGSGGSDGYGVGRIAAALQRLRSTAPACTGRDTGAGRPRRSRPLSFTRDRPFMMDAGAEVVKGRLLRAGLGALAGVDRGRVF